MLAGLLGGYMGLGGGVIMVPYMTIILGLDIKEAVPIAMIAIVVGTLSASTPYIRKSMVDTELAIIISISMVVGSVIGSLLLEIVSSAKLQLIFSVAVLYAGMLMLFNKSDKKPAIRREFGLIYYFLASALSLVIGVIATMIGLGGGIFIIPMLYLLFGISIASARGTSALTIGFGAATAAIVFYFKGQLDPAAAVPVMLGVAAGGTAGGHLGTVARPVVVKIIFFIIMIYIAYKLGVSGLKEL